MAQKLPGRRRRYRSDPQEFGFDPPDRDSAEVMPPASIDPGGDPSEPAPEIVAIGLPPEDASGIQKWNYRVLSTMGALVLRDKNISDETRMKRFMALSLAAARHYPEAVKHDLNEAIRRDAEGAAARKRAKAAGQLEKRGPAAGAKVIPLRRDAPST